MGGGVSFLTTSLQSLNNGGNGGGEHNASSNGLLSPLVCGVNERYSPPLVLFLEADETGDNVPTFIVKV